MSLEPLHKIQSSQVSRLAGSLILTQKRDQGAMEKELVKKVVKITNFTVTEIQKLIDIYKETTQVFSTTKHT